MAPPPRPNYRLPFIPGPTGMSESVRQVYATDYGSPDVESSFWEDYEAAGEGVRKLVGAKAAATVVIGSGEGMAGLWGALKSTLAPSDEIVCIANGVFGAGFADMARAIGCKARVLDFPWDAAVNWPESFNDAQKEALRGFLASPAVKMVTVVHCETPSGVLNDFSGLSEFMRANSPEGSCPLLLMDFVSSAGAVPVRFDEWGVDIGLLAPQKVVSGPPALAVTVVTDKAWQAAEAVGYQGYDALLPFKDAARLRFSPYTHNWAAVAAFVAALDEYFAEGADGVAARHARCADVCWGWEDPLLKPYCKSRASGSPTVTAFRLPDSVSFSCLKAALAARGAAVGGSYGPLDGKVFRIGHMGRQADPIMVAEVLTIAGEELKKLVGPGGGAQ